MSGLTVRNRDMQVKAKKLRRTGFVPGCVYGGQLLESISVQMEKRDAEKLLREKRIGSRMDLNLENKKIDVLLKEVDRDILANQILHIGFQALDSDTKVNSVANIILLEKDKCVGVVDQVMFEIPFAALPDNLVENVAIDISQLRMGDRVLVSDLDIARDQTVQLLVDADSLILTISESKLAAAEGQEDKAE